MVRPTVEIIPFASHHRSAFKALNIAWLTKYFVVEPIDEEILSAPDNILQSGGHIFMARHGDNIVGTCSLLNAGNRQFELSKMAVDEQFQGMGIGRQLLEAAVQRYRDYPDHELFLETNSLLQPAINLYESVGFRHAPRPDGPSHYARANVYMIYNPS